MGGGPAESCCLAASSSTGRVTRGDHAAVALEVTISESRFGAVLNFTLRVGPDGFEPVDIWVEALSMEGV